MFEHELNSLAGNSLLRSLRALESVDGPRAVIDGREYTLFCTNDYLGLSGHPALIEAAKHAAQDMGFGAGSAPLICGRSKYHARLEADIASLKRTDAALAFGSGYLANSGLIPALATTGDVVISDRLNHASIIDGCRLSRAVIKVYPHADMDALDAALKASYMYRRRFVVTEGVFGMDGDIALMPEILELAVRYDAHVILDDAHGTGVIGETGGGTLEHFGLPVDRVVQMGTLGKAAGSYGAFVAGPDDVISWLVNSARSFMFSTALPHPVCAAASAGIGLMKDARQLRDALRRNAEMLRNGIAGIGLTVFGKGTPIIPVVTGGADEAVRLSAALIDKGFFAPAIRPPTVPAGESRIRFTVSALHTGDDIAALIDALKGLA